MTKIWQNLVHGKCPNCSERLLRDRRFFKCPTDGCLFIIGNVKMAAILTDPNHAALRYLSKHERDELSAKLKKLGTVV